MLKKIFGRVKSQKGMSGVLVAMLLVVVGVGLVAGVSTFMTNAKTDIQKAAGESIYGSGDINNTTSNTY